MFVARETFFKEVKIEDEYFLENESIVKINFGDDIRFNGMCSDNGFHSFRETLLFFCPNVQFG